MSDIPTGDQSAKPLIDNATNDRSAKPLSHGSGSHELKKGLRHDNDPLEVALTMEDMLMCSEPGMADPLIALIGEEDPQRSSDAHLKRSLRRGVMIIEDAHLVAFDKMEESVHDELVRQEVTLIFKYAWDIFQLVSNDQSMTLQLSETIMQTKCKNLIYLLIEWMDFRIGRFDTKELSWMAQKAHFADRLRAATLAGLVRQEFVRKRSLGSDVGKVSDIYDSCFIISAEWQLEILRMWVAQLKVIHDRIALTTQRYRLGDRR